MPRRPNIPSDLIPAKPAKAGRQPDEVYEMAFRYSVSDTPNGVLAAGDGHLDLLASIFVQGGQLHTLLTVRDGKDWLTMTVNPYGGRARTVYDGPLEKYLRPETP